MNIKTVLITGAARRLGRAIAEHLHQQGMRILLHYHTSQDAAQALADQLNQLRPNSVHALQANLRVHADLERLAKAAQQVWGQVDGLINNASAFFPTAIGETSQQDWDHLMGANLKAPFFLSQLLAPALKFAGGSIINITDIHGEKPLKNYPVYSMTKAGLIMLTHSLAKELGPEIRVNAISPGSILWPEGANVLDTTLQADIVERTALKRKGTPLDIAKASNYLLNADYVTGQVLAVDGGRLLNC
ncbi:MAG: pteridine reductase [Gammaproteobacteria bacterium]